MRLYQSYFTNIYVCTVELCTAVTADDDISNHATKVKINVHIGFV